MKAAQATKPTDKTKPQQGKPSFSIESKQIILTQQLPQFLK